MEINEETCTNRYLKRNVMIIIYLIFISCMYILLWKKACIQYQTNDDFYLAALCSGIYGKYIPYTVFTNIVYGFILSGLYYFLPICNWFTVLNLAGTYVAYILLSCLLIKKNSPIVGLSYSITLFLCTYSTILLQMNWTKFCAFFAITGFIILSETVEYNNRIIKNIGIIIGCIFCLWAYIIRIQAFLLVVPFGLLIKIKQFSNIKSNWNYYRIVIGILLATVIFWGIDQITYNTDEWKDYNDYNSLLKILDYGFPQYLNYHEEYESIGYTMTDIDYLERFYISDRDIFHKESLKKASMIKKQEVDSMQNFLENLVQAFEDNYFNGCMAFITIILLISLLLGERMFSFKAGLWGGLLIVEIVTLHVMGRPIERVISIPILSCFICCLFSLSKVFSISQIKRLAGMLLVYCLLFSKILFLKDFQYCIGRTDTTDFLNYISQKEELYVWDIYDSRVLSAYDPCDVLPENLLVNSTYDSGWPSIMPFFEKRVNDFTDDSNLCRALLNSDKVYLIGNNNIDLKRNYIELHYGERVSYSLIESPYGFEIYSFNEYKDARQREKKRWRVSEITTYGEDLFMIKGNIYSKNVESGYLNIQNKEKKFTYQIKIEDGEFWVGIPCSDWKCGEDVRVSYLYVERDNVKKSTLEYDLRIPEKDEAKDEK